MTGTINKKRKPVYGVIAVWVTILLTAALIPMTAYAAENPLTLSVNQTAPEGAAFNYRLMPLSPGNPMPQGSITGGYYFTITGNSSAQIGPMSFTRHNLYRYELAQVIETENPDYTYDRRVYIIEVHVDDALNTALILVNANGTKADNILFENRRLEPPVISKPDVPGESKPDEGKPGKPGPITGDDIKTALYYTMIVLGGTAAAGAAIYLVAGKKRKKGDGYENR